MQALGAVLITSLIDNERIGGRRARGMISIAIVAGIVIAGWIGTTVFLYRHPYNPLKLTNWDWKDSEWVGYFILNLIAGVNACVVSYCSPVSESETSNKILSTKSALNGSLRASAMSHNA